MGLVKTRRPSDVHSLVTLQLTYDARELTMVNKPRIFKLGLAYLIARTNWRWVIQSQIDFTSFNEIY